MILTDKEIEVLINEPKILNTKSIRKLEIILNSSNNDFFIGQTDFDVYGENNKFRIIWRSHKIYRHNFSVGLMYIPERHFTGPFLKRCNGKHPTPHINEIEKTKFTNKYHIHTATERYALKGLKKGRKKYDIAKYAEPTEKYTNPVDAFQCLLNDCNIRYPQSIKTLCDGYVEPES